MSALAERTGHARLRSECRAMLEQGRRALNAAYLAQPRPAHLLREHARLVDGVLHRLWMALGAPAGSALAAVGGYGRGELYPCSDVDVLIRVSEHTAHASAFAEQLVGLLWDVGEELVGAGVGGEAVGTEDSES